MNQSLEKSNTNLVPFSQKINYETEHVFLNDKIKNKLIAKENLKICLYRSLFFKVFKFSFILVSKCYSFFSKNIKMSLSGICFIGGIFTIIFDFLYLRYKFKNTSIITRKFIVELLKRIFTIAIASFIYYYTYDRIESSIRDNITNKFLIMILSNSISFNQLFLSMFFIESLFDVVFTTKVKEEIILKDIYSSKEVIEESIKMFHFKDEVSLSELELKMRDLNKIYTDNRIKDEFVKSHNEEMLKKYKMAYEIIIKNINILN